MTNGFFAFNSGADVITRYNFNQVRCFFTLNIFHGLIGYISKQNAQIIHSRPLPIYICIYVYIYIYIYVYIYIYI